MRSWETPPKIMATICPLPTGRASVHKTAGWLYQSVRGDCWATAAPPAVSMASATTVSLFIEIVGQLVKLRASQRVPRLPALRRRVTNPPQVANLPHTLTFDRDGRQIAAEDDAIDHAVGDGLIRLHDVVAVHILGYALHRLAGGAGQHGIENFAHAQDFAGVDIDIGRLTGQTLHGGLVDHDARVRQAEAFTLGSLGQQHGRHGSRLTDTDGDNVGPDERPGVENRPDR